MGMHVDERTDGRREAFVRARFAKPSVFGRADIEAWLADQREIGIPTQTPSPWDAPAFEDSVMRRWSGPDRAATLAAVLQHRATPTPSLPDEMFGTPQAFAARAIMLGLSRGSNVYYAGGIRTAIVITRGIPVSMTREPLKPEVAMFPASPADVLWILMEEQVAGRPRSRAAFDWMRDEYAAAIAAIRADAERDFDEQRA